MNQYSNNFDQQYQNNNDNLYYNQLNNNVNCNNKKNFKNKKYIIVIIIVLVCCIFLTYGVTNFFRNNNYSNGIDTVNIGDELKIKELNGIFNFSIEVMSPVEKKHIIKDGIFSMDEYDAYAVKVNVKNYSDNDLSLNDGRLAYQLIDASNNKIEILNNYDAFDFDNSIKSTIKAGESAIGYLYFYDILSDINTSSININNVSSLEIGVLTNTTTTDGYITGKYESYYVILK